LNLGISRAFSAAVWKVKGRNMQGGDKKKKEKKRKKKKEKKKGRRENEEESAVPGRSSGGTCVHRD
jgi:hypothetical protein